VRTEALLSSTAVRLSLIYAGILILSFLLAGSLTWFIAGAVAERALRERIELEVHALTTEIATEGLGPGVDAIQSRTKRPGAFEYWLTGPSGERLVGDLPLMVLQDGWHMVDFPDTTAGAEGRGSLLILSETMPDGSRLSIGEDLRRAAAVRGIVLRVLAGIGAAAAAAGLMASIVATRNVLSRMAALGATIDQVRAGDLSARFLLGSRKQPDDLDRLGRGVNAMLDRIDELIAGIRRASHDVAHDLRTPLTHLRQRLEEARNARTQEARHDALLAAEEKVDDILRVFDAMLRLAEIEAESVPHPFEPVDAAALIERVVDAYRPDIEAGGRTIDIMQIDPATITADAELITQALANVIENAMCHTPQGSHLAVRLTRAPGESRIEVADDGPGIAEVNRGRVLEPFVRLDDSRTTKGSGLGLSIVAAIARLHRATLSLEDAGPGLLVRLRFYDSPQG